MGLTRLYDLKVSLYSIGWTPRRTASKMYRMAYSATNQNQTSLILMRKNGIDVQIIESLPTKTIRPNSILSISQSNGPFIRQPFYGSRDNILERTLKFAKAFLKNLENLETMIEPLQTTKTLPKALFVKCRECPCAIYEIVIESTTNGRIREISQWITRNIRTGYQE